MRNPFASLFGKKEPNVQPDYELLESHLHENETPKPTDNVSNKYSNAKMAGYVFLAFVAGATAAAATTYYVMTKEKSDQCESNVDGALTVSYGVSRFNYNESSPNASWVFPVLTQIGQWSCKQFCDLAVVAAFRALTAPHYRQECQRTMHPVSY
jgi:hypothetical protein